jgi:hypothetical protein
MSAHNEPDCVNIIVDYLGFCPSRYYLKQCCRFLQSLVDGSVVLSAEDFIMAVKHRFVDYRLLYLGPRENTLCVLKFIIKHCGEISGYYFLKKIWGPGIRRALTVLPEYELPKLMAWSTRGGTLSCSIECNCLLHA